MRSLFVPHLPHRLLLSVFTFVLLGSYLLSFSQQSIAHAASLAPTSAVSVVALKYYSESTTQTHWITSGPVDPNYTDEGVAGYLSTVQLSGMLPLYGCYYPQGTAVYNDADNDGDPGEVDSDDLSSYNDHFPSLSSTCVQGAKLDSTLGSQYKDLLGYLYPPGTPVSGAFTPIYLCQAPVTAGFSHDVFQDTSCQGRSGEGWTYNGPIGSLYSTQTVYDCGGVTGNDGTTTDLAFSQNDATTLASADQQAGSPSNVVNEISGNPCATLPHYDADLSQKVTFDDSATIVSTDPGSLCLQTQTYICGTNVTKKVTLYKTILGAKRPIATVTFIQPALCGIVATGYLYGADCKSDPAQPTAVVNPIGYGTFFNPEIGPVVTGARTPYAGNGMKGWTVSASVLYSRPVVSLGSDAVSYQFTFGDLIANP